MALNKNHEFEELDGVKCGIVEKNVKPERVVFIKELLEFNGYTVIVVPTPPPKAAPAPAPAKVLPATEDSADKPAPVAEVAPPPPPPPPPTTFTVGVTDYTFNTINAIFGRILKTKDGHIVTLAYWQQQEAVSQDEIPYFDK